MKARVAEALDKLRQPPKHASYRAHRKQVIWQVILPVALAAVLLVALIAWIAMTAFGGGSELGRWAAISTMWIMLPVIVLGLVALVILCGVIYLAGRVLGIIPVYTGIAQDYAFRAEAIVKRITAAAVRPVFWLDEAGAYVRALFGRK
jgi:hypothetical protein